MNEDIQYKLYVMWMGLSMLDVIREIHSIRAKYLLNKLKHHKDGMFLF